MFKKGNEKSKEEKDPIVLKCLSIILNDEILFKPVYLKELKTEEEAEIIDELPLVYLWNEDINNGTFSLSINGRIIGRMLESYCSRNDPKFVPRRDEITNVLSDVSKKSVVNICSRLRISPSKIF